MSAWMLLSGLLFLMLAGMIYCWDKRCNELKEKDKYIECLENAYFKLKDGYRTNSK